MGLRAQFRMEGERGLRILSPERTRAREGSEKKKVGGGLKKGGDSELRVFWGLFNRRGFYQR